MTEQQPRCQACGHPAFLKGSHGVPPSQWRHRCLVDGCPCAPDNCRPDQGGTATSKESNSMSTPSADDFLMGGGGAPTAKFDTRGVTVGGRITEPPTVQQQRDIQTGEKKFWSDGNPMMQLVVTVQTDRRDPAIPDDDGRRRLFVKGQMKQAVQEAVKASGARGLEVGGHLSVTYTHDGEAKQRGFSPPKQYRAQYTPAASAELHAQDPAAAYSMPAAPPAAVPGLTPEQIAAAAANPATAALLAQMQAQQAAPAPQTGTVPPF
ncbi:hypothetical protein [Kitasatospora sp. A2-31]|uniref:hypothetical protein n=1 Tax=Kitasatospora sp. A2-31 TaxID=2916414 RepID=UPI001EEE4C18|nr:hypothetical protein [Kitasatospora sp. A2-31]MCG6499425.1 hypothetical protein [Kitasatospora sp. A2-31]